MKKSHLLSLILIIFVVVGCSVSADAENLIKPGGKIGEMTVDQKTTVSYTQNFWFFCEFMPDEQEPFSISSECELPSQMANIDIGFGWAATEDKIASNWDAIAWELHIDGYQIDLEAFNWVETLTAEKRKSRDYIVTLQDLSPGLHNLRLSWSSQTAVDDGTTTYQPGIYQQEVTFTVPE